jgi:SAM-dependent methyltransferase
MYVFDNAADQTAARFEALTSMFDEGTIRHIEARGIRSGWTCLEIGGGGGSVATWLARRVGPTGRVLATDIDTRYLERLRLPNLDVRRHSVEVDPLPTAMFDLVHARLVVMHLADKAAALQRMVSALKPGGWLVVEDFEIGPSTDSTSKALAAMRQVMEAEGVDLHYGRKLPGQFRALGLEDVDTEGRAFLWRGGSHGAALIRANYEQLEYAILETGLVTRCDLDDEVARLADPTFATRSPILWSVWGRRG